MLIQAFARWKLANNECKAPHPVMAKGTTTHQLPKPAPWESSLIPHFFLHLTSQRKTGQLASTFAAGWGTPRLTLTNELAKETHMLIQQEILLGWGAWVESRRVREARRTTLQWVAVLGFYGDGISFWVVSSRSFGLRVLPGGSRIAQPRWMSMRTIPEGGRTRGSFWPSPNSSGW